jgi:hypothetical protein
MATITTTVTNGVSMGFKHTVTSQDASDGYVIIDFDNVDYDLAAIVQVINPSDADPNAASPVEMLDAQITYPENGQVRIANGDSLFTLTAGQVVTVIAQRASAESS